jgi:hypothetical protein
MLMSWIWDPEEGRVQIKLPENVKPKMFLKVVQGIVDTFPKGVEFTPKDVAEKFDIKQQTASKYLQEMMKQDLLKPEMKPPVTAYHRGCTPREELDANIRSVFTFRGNFKFKRTSRIGEQVITFIDRREPLLPFRRNRPLLNNISKRIKLKLYS